MPVTTLHLRPGVDTEISKRLNAQGWSASNLIRFRQGQVEKIGGWVSLNSTALVGTGRGIHGWADLNGLPYIAAGTEQRLQIYDGGVMEDITPIRQTDNVTPAFSTTAGSTTVTVYDPANGADATDWVNVEVPVSVGGVIIQGFYQVQSIVDDNDYTITIATAAGSTASMAGLVPEFTATAGSPNVQVTLPDHGLVAGGIFTVQVATSVGSGISISAGDYSVQAPVTTDSFFIAPGGTASVDQSVFENSGDARLEYLIHTGFASTTALTGYGAGNYGSGDYGGANSSGGTITGSLRQWFLNNWGQDLLASYTNGPIYYWVPPFASGNVATQLPATDAPTISYATFIAMPEQIMVSLGSETGGAQQPNLIRWSTDGDFGLADGSWTATATNQAGSFTIPTGSRIVGGIQGPLYSLIWTDIDVWLMQYLGFPLVFGFNNVANGCGLIAARAVGVYESLVFWMSNDNFYVYNGSSVSVLPCTVWDQIFYNIDLTQADKVFCAVNSLFKEVAWFYPSATGTGEVDSYVKYNIAENLWDFGSLVRTCWTDVSAAGNPVGTDTSGLIQQHDNEGIFDANGQPLLASITSGFMALDDAAVFTFLERIFADFVFEGSGTLRAYITITTQNYPGSPIITYGPYPFTASTLYQPVRARGRTVAIEISSQDLGVFWRMGAVRTLTSPAGRR